MDMKGLTCKQCSKKYHHCGGCGMDTAADNGYCSSTCLDASDEFKQAKVNAQALYDSLSKDQKKQFEQFQIDESHFEYMSLYKEEVI